MTIKPRKTALLAALALAGFAGTAAVTTLYRDRVAADPQKSALVALAGIGEDDYVSLRFDKIRELVNAHSLHKGDDKAMMASADVMDVYRFAVGERDSSPVLESRQRAELMADLLKAAGYKSRLVTLYSGKGEGHTMVEAFNPQTRRWELQDVDHDVFFVFSGSTQRAAAADMIELPLENFRPCQMEGYCSWQSFSAETLPIAGLRPYFAAAWYEAGRRPRLEYNADRLDVAGLCAVLPEVCAGQVNAYDEPGA